MALGAKMGPRPPQDSLQDKFWTYFGRFLEPRWPQDLPTWSQAGPKTSQSAAKMAPRPPNLEPGCRGQIYLGPSWRQDGPKRPQGAPKGAQDSLQDRCWSNFGGFLVDFFVVFWLVWGFISALVVCCGGGLLLCWFVGCLTLQSNIGRGFRTVPFFCCFVGLLFCWFVGLLCFVGLLIAGLLAASLSSVCWFVRCLTLQSQARWRNGPQGS